MSAHFVARVSYVKRHSDYVVFKIRELYRGHLRAVQWHLVVRDSHAVACQTASRHYSAADSDDWLLVGGSLVHGNEYIPSATALSRAYGNFSMVTPIALHAPGCSRPKSTSASEPNDAGVVWMAQWQSLSRDVISTIIQDNGIPDAWWRQKQAWTEFSHAMNRADDITKYTNASLPIAKDQLKHHAAKDGEWWVRDGISIIAACKDRTKTLSKALPSWLLADGVDEVVLVDWSSTPSIADSIGLQLASDARVTLVRADGQSEWILSRAYNLAARSAIYSRIMKVDCDTQLETDFFKSHPLPRDAFYAGNWRTLENGTSEDLHANGLLYAFRDDFLSVGGYDERIATYGWDDSDIAERLAGIRRSESILFTKVRHLEHPASLRVINQHLQSVLPPNNPHAAAVEIQRNRLLLTKFHLPSWKAISSHMLWNAGSPTLPGERIAHGVQRMGFGFSVRAATAGTSATSLISDADSLDVSKRAIRVILHRYGVPLYPKSFSLEFYKNTIHRLAFPNDFAEVAISLRGGCVSKLIAHVVSKVVTTDPRTTGKEETSGGNAYMPPPRLYEGWRLQEFWRHPDVECTCPSSSLFEFTDQELSAEWIDTGNPIPSPVPVATTQPRTNVTEFLDSFEILAHEKKFSEELARWQGKEIHPKPRMLIGELACDSNPDLLSPSQIEHTRLALRQLQPAPGVREAFQSAVRRRNLCVLDAPEVGLSHWSKHAGEDFVERVESTFASTEMLEMASKWAGGSLVSPGLSSQLNRRAGVLSFITYATALRLHEDSDGEMSAKLRDLLTTVSSEVDKLFVGCTSSPYSFFSAYPELAIIGASLFSSRTCM